jgi:Zn finger protein HypA/HybF involved in hydrogenase expression
MHDVHAVRALVDRLITELAGPAAGAVCEVHVRADVTLSPEALEQAYEMLTPGTVLKGSRLVVDETAAEHLCGTCGVASPVTHDDVAGHLLICPSCGSLAPLEGFSGLRVTGIELAEAG